MEKRVNWIIENINNESSYKELADACVSEGFSYYYLNNNTDYRTIQNVIDEKDRQPFCSIVNGSIELTRIIGDYLRGISFPVTFSNFENYKCSKYYSQVGKYLFNDRYFILSLSELSRNRFFIYGILGKEAVIFIRPDSGEKTFQAQLLDLLDLDRFIETNKHLLHELVVVSSPKDIFWEGRFIIGADKKEIIAHSTYRYQDQVTKIPSVPTESINKCKEILNNMDTFPDKVFCIDLCQGMDREFYLLELTSFSSAGLYAADKRAIVRKVSEIALKEFDNWNLPF